MMIVLLMIVNRDLVGVDCATDDRNRDLVGDDCSTDDREQRSGWC